MSFSLILNNKNDASKPSFKACYPKSLILYVCRNPQQEPDSLNLEIQHSITDMASTVAVVGHRHQVSGRCPATSRVEGENSSSLRRGGTGEPP
ncbi:hypothetical protein CDL15_Pgr011716 [Punica granatum]|uniref:Uncharacterized protein n=1 Tax=Punica granatum TaxID=22663 RepID=A0A218WXQ2_PUNGR|nr:hypothetical protein CDL15_Pgr011716 [Punica granatum]PKI46706.1 hypothetical protein CRG98_032901 [Punica granatum]